MFTWLVSSIVVSIQPTAVRGHGTLFHPGSRDRHSRSKRVWRSCAKILLHRRMADAFEPESPEVLHENKNVFLRAESTLSDDDDDADWPSTPVGNVAEPAVLVQQFARYLPSLSHPPRLPCPSASCRRPAVHAANSATLPCSENG